MLKLEKWTCTTRILSEFTAVATEVVQNSVSLAYTVVAQNMDSELLLKSIGYFPN